MTLDDRAYEMSTSPCMPDSYQKYHDSGNSQPKDGAGGNLAGNSAGLNLGGVRNPFNNYGEMGNEIPRGAYKPVAIQYVPRVGALPAGYTAGDRGYTVVDWEVTEPLFISPLSSGKYNCMGLSQVSTMDCDISWDSGKILRLLSVDQALTTNNTQDTFGGIGAQNITAETSQLDINNSSVIFTPEGSAITFIYYTPQINRPKPEALIYPYHDYYVYHKDIGNIANGAIRTKQQSDNMSLSSIPSKVYIYSRLKEGDRTPFTSDNFARISAIDINFNGVSGILSSSREHELFRMSSNNGLKISYPEWKHYTGSVLCIDFGSNMGLGPQQCVGMLDSAGTFSISNGQIVKQLGVVSSSDVLEAEDYKEMDGEYLQKLYGGTFLEGSKIARDLADPIGMFAPRVGKALKTGSYIADLLAGQGYSKAQANKMAKQYTPAQLKKIMGGNTVKS